jgi:hypothetical protein
MPLFMSAVPRGLGACNHPLDLFKSVPMDARHEAAVRVAAMLAKVGDVHPDLVPLSDYGDEETFNFLLPKSASRFSKESDSTSPPRITHFETMKKPFTGRKPKPPQRLLGTILARPDSAAFPRVRPQTAV